MYAPLDFTALHYSQTHKEAILWLKTGANVQCVFAYCDMIKASVKEKKEKTLLFCVVAGGAEQLADLGHGSTQVGGEVKEGNHACLIWAGGQLCPRC